MRFFAAVAGLLLAACNTAGPDPDIAVEDAWARATIAGQGASAAYFTLANAGGADRLVAVSTPGGKASLHSSSTDGGVIRMRPVEAVDVPAGATVELRPGAMHVMLTGLDQPLVAGATLTLDLRFEKSGEQRVEAAIRPATGAKA